MKRFFLMITIWIFILIGCQPSALKIAGEKMDYPLRTRIAEKKSETIYFLGVCDKPITNAMRLKMEQTGVLILRVLDRLFNARGKPEDIVALAQLPFIEKLEAASQMNP